MMLSKSPTQIGRLKQKYDWRQRLPYCSTREIGSSIAACATFHVVGENYDVRPTAPTFRPSLPSLVPRPSTEGGVHVLERLVAIAVSRSVQTITRSEMF